MTDTQPNHLQGELTSVQHGALERVLLLLQLGSSALSSCEEVLQNGWQKTLSLVLLDEEI